MNDNKIKYLLKDKIKNLSDFKIGSLYRFRNENGYRGVFISKNKNVIIDNGEILLYIGNNWVFNDFKNIEQLSQIFIYKEKTVSVFLTDELKNNINAEYGFYKIC